MDQTVYNFSIKTINGETLSLADFKGKKILLVNVASFCGFTKQYAQLQELHENFGDKVAVVGLPCNDFGGQEPGSAKEIALFCESNFHVTFPITEKIVCVGEHMHPLYKFLTSKELNGKEDSEVVWNFQKYLIDENGNYVTMFPPNIDPLDEALLKAIGV